MLRRLLGLRALLPLGRGAAAAATPAPAAGPAWEGAWRRLFATHGGPRAISRRAPAQNSSPLQLLGGAARHGAQRPRLRGAATPSRGQQRRGFSFSGWRRSGADGDKAQERLSLGARLKKLSKEYGWSAVGVYLGLSVLDFPFCFLLVRIVGTDTIGKIEHYVVSSVKSMVPDPVRQKLCEYWSSVKEVEADKLGDDGISEKVEMAGWGVEEAQERNKEEASLATQLALAYAIHKSFIFVRVPLTAAVTPRVVKVLRSWGWNIGKKRP